MSEKETLEHLRSLALTKAALRKYCVMEQKARVESFEGKLRFLYDRLFIKGLAENYWPKEVVFEKYPHQRTKFYGDIKLCRRIQIGKRLLIHQGDVVKVLLPKIKPYGPVAHLGERSPRTGEVAGSTPARSTYVMKDSKGLRSGS